MLNNLCYEIKQAIESEVLQNNGTISAIIGENLTSSKGEKYVLIGFVYVYTEDESLCMRAIVEGFSGYISKKINDNPSKNHLGWREYPSFSLCKDEDGVEQKKFTCRIALQ